MVKRGVKVKDKLSAKDLAALNADIAKLVERELTGEGFLKTPARIARIGVQEYTALELGIDATLKIIRLYRSPAEVFKQETLDTFEAQTITYYHPEKGVDSGNWKSTAVGDFHNVAQDDTDEAFVRADLIIRDADAVRAVAYGVKELSCGYLFDLDMTPGTTPEGEAYDGLQTNIVGNHLAIVYSGRCGSGCRVGDCACQHRPNPTTDKETTMATRKLTVDGFNLELEETQAAIVERVVADCARKVTDADKARKEAEDKAAASAAGLEAASKAAADAKVAHDAKVVELTAKVTDAEGKILTDEQEASRVEERTKVVADAKAILGEDFDAKGKSLHAIRVAALDHVIANDETTKAAITPALGGAEPAKAAPAIAKIAFDTAIAVLAAGGGGNAEGAEYQRQVADALVGKDKKAADKAPKLGGRQLMIARERGQATAARQ